MEIENVKPIHRSQVTNHYSLVTDKMKKSLTLKWELEFNTSNSSCLLWKTVVPNYEFVAQFNEVFNTALTRTEEIEIFGNTGFPMFTYCSALKQLTYLLIDNVDNKIDEALKGYDKILIINGRDAFENQIQIYNDFYSEQSIWGFEDQLTRMHHESVAAFKQYVAKLDYFNYQGPLDKVLLVGNKRKNARATSSSLANKTSDMDECFECLLGEIERYYYDD